MPTARVTLVRVAEVAGVSPTTVSHALNGRGRVSEQTRAQIVAVAADLGYVASPLARALRGGRSMLLLVQLPAAAHGRGLHSAFLRNVLIGAAETAMGRGYTLAIASPAATAREQLPPADGALVVDPVVEDVLIAHARDCGLPVTTVTRFAGQPVEMLSVDADYTTGMRTILDHLAAVGYRQPALLTAGEPLAYSTGCLAAYEEWVSAQRVSSRVSTAPSYPSIDEGAAAARELLERRLPPDALVAVTESLALGAERELTRARARVPQDVGLVSMSDSERLRSSGVSALELHPADLGRQAAELLIDSIESTDDDPRTLRSRQLPTELSVRTSTARVLDSDHSGPR